MRIKHLSKLTTARYFHDSGLPCLVRIMRAAPSNAFIPFHGHEFAELVLVASGTIKHLHDRSSEVLHAGDFFIVHPGTRHGYAELSDDAIVYNLLYTDAMRGFVRLFPPDNLTRKIFPAGRSDCQPSVLGTLEANQIRRVTQLLDEMRAEEKSICRTSVACCGALFAATVAILARGERQEASPPSPTLPIKAELTYLNEHLGEKITLASLCRVADKSPSTLNRLFRAAFGKSPIDYLIERRLDEAMILCASTDDPLAVLATRCGFVDASHLLRTCKRHGRNLPQRRSLPSHAN